MLQKVPEKNKISYKKLEVTGVTGCASGASAHAFGSSDTLSCHIQIIIFVLCLTVFITHSFEAFGTSDHLWWVLCGALRIALSLLIVLVFIFIANMCAHYLPEHLLSSAVKKARNSWFDWLWFEKNSQLFHSIEVRSETNQTNLVRILFKLKMGIVC